MIGQEEWLPVVGHEGYEVSDHGRVRSLDRIIIDSAGRERPMTGRVRRLTPNTSGHLSLILGGPDGHCTVTVHHLVLEAFVGPCPEGMEGRHLDDDKANNGRTNLTWGTRSENVHDRVRNGIHHGASRTHCPRRHLLALPNLIAAAKRSCLACGRTHSAAQRAASAGRPFDFQAESDRRYAEIMGVAA